MAAVLFEIRGGAASEVEDRELLWWFLFNASSGCIDKGTHLAVEVEAEQVCFRVPIVRDELDDWAPDISSPGWPAARDAMLAAKGRRRLRILADRCEGEGAESLPEGPGEGSEHAG